MPNTTLKMNKMKQAEINQKYAAKQRESFETKLRYYVFHQVMHGELEGDYEDFISMPITRELIAAYNGQFWQYETHHEVEYSNCDKLTVAEIDKTINDWLITNEALVEEMRKQYCQRFEEQIFPREDFKKLVAEDSCYYCGTTIKDVEELAEHAKIFKKNYRGWSFGNRTLKPPY
jgi:hypothetical protein